MNNPTIEVLIQFPINLLNSRGDIGFPKVLILRRNIFESCRDGKSSGNAKLTDSTNQYSSSLIDYSVSFRGDTVYVPDSDFVNLVTEGNYGTHVQDHIAFEKLKTDSNFRYAIDTFWIDEGNGEKTAKVYYIFYSGNFDTLIFEDNRMLIVLDIKSNKFEVGGIHIGDTKEKVCEALNIKYFKNKVYIIFFDTLDIYLTFDNEILTRIYYYWDFE